MYDDVALTQPGLWLNWLHVIVSSLLASLLFFLKRKQGTLKPVILHLVFVVILSAGILQFIIFCYGMDFVFSFFGLMPQNPFWWKQVTLFFAIFYGLMLPVKENKC